MKIHHTKSERGVALVTTIIVVTVMATIAIALLQSTGTDRFASRTVANHFKARLFADAASAEAVNLLVSTSVDRPDLGFQTFMVNSYVERTVNFENTPIVAPYLATHRLAPDFSSIAETRLLVSLGNSTDISNVPPENLFDINNLVTCSSPNPIGLTDNSTGIAIPRPVPVAWVNVLKNPAIPQNNDQSNADYNPVIGRFAFWVDDESSKLDIRTAGNLTAAGEIFRGAGTNPNQVSPVPFLGVNASMENNPAGFIQTRDQASADGILLTEDTTRLFDGPAAAYLSNNYEDLKSMLTIYSRADERGSFGTRKINLNDYVALNTNLESTDSRNRIAADTVALGEYINQVIPQFGNRAYSGSVLDSDRRRYCIQIAANIRDYIDEDSQPTAITQNDRWLQPPDPDGEGEGAPDNPPLAFGKEVVPSVTEYVGYYYNSNGALRIDHSFEILNIYTSSVNMTGLGQLRILMSERNPLSRILPPGPPNGGREQVSNLPGMEGGANPPLLVNIPTSAAFPPGQYRILTTLPAGSPLRSEWVAPNAVFVDVTSNENTYPYGSHGLRMQGDHLASSADVLTEISLINNFGYLDFHARVAQQGSPNQGILNFTTATNQTKIATQPFGNDGSGAGNNIHRRYPLDSGDPRSMTDFFPAFTEPGGTPSSIAWRRHGPNSAASNNTLLGGDSELGTFGFIPDNTGDSRDHVPEPLLQSGNQQLIREIATIRNGPMRTIGELGLIYDPAVHGTGYNNRGGAATRERGGFRTLSIGSDVGEARGPNRLAHTMPTTVNSTISQRRAYRLLDIFTANNSETGKILVNSSLRNPQNLPLRALFHNLQFQSNTTSNATSEFSAPQDGILDASDKDLNIDALISEWISFERSRGPFLSTGQLADLATFSNSSLNVNLTPNSENTNALDRGREELLRNTFGLLTLKGSVYKIYAVGQSGTVDSNGEFKPTATAFLEKTVELERTYPQENGLISTTPTDLVTNNRATNINVKNISTKFY